MSPTYPGLRAAPIRPTWHDLYAVLAPDTVDLILERTGGRFTREELEARLAEDERDRTTVDPACKTVYALLREIPADGDLVAQWHRERAEDQDRAADAIEAGDDPLDVTP